MSRNKVPMSRSHKNSHVVAFASTCLLGFIAYASGCSVPDRTYYDDGGGTSNGGTQTNGGSANHGGTSNGGTGNIGQAGQGEAGTGATTSAPIHGLLAVAGVTTDKASQDVVSLIDPTTGAELARQTISGATVVGLAYDGADNKDVWFEFTSTSFPAPVDSKADLQVYAFDDTTSKWSAVAAKAVTALPPPRADSFVVLNDRLSYLSHDTVSGVDTLTVLDTTDPKAVTQIKFTSPTFAGEVIGMVGTRGAPGDPTATGGTLAILIGEGCAGANASRTCMDLAVLPVFVGSDDVSAAALKPYSATFGGQPAFTSAQATQLAYVAFPPATGNVKLQYFDPRDLTTVKNESVAFASRWLGGLAYAECQKVAVFTAVAEGELYAVTPSGLTENVELGYPGQTVVYEPFTGRAITLFNPDNPLYQNSGFVAPAGAGGEGGGSSSDSPSLNAFDVASDATLSAVSAANWKPPTDLAANLAVARFPVSYQCK